MNRMLFQSRYAVCLQYIEASRSKIIRLLHINFNAGRMMPMMEMCQLFSSNGVFMAIGKLHLLTSLKLFSSATAKKATFRSHNEVTWLVQFSADGHAKSTRLFLQGWQYFQLLLSL
jgi:hypothetical protein